MAEPSHLHDTRVFLLMQGTETVHAGRQYQRWFCQGCDTVTLLPAAVAKPSSYTFSGPVRSPNVDPPLRDPYERLIKALHKVAARPHNSDFARMLMNLADELDITR